MAVLFVTPKHKPVDPDGAEEASITAVRPWKKNSWTGKVAGGGGHLAWRVEHCAGPGRSCNCLGPHRCLYPMGGEVYRQFKPV